MHTFPNGKRYIGVAIQHEGWSKEYACSKRWGKDGYGYHTMQVYYPILKYGWENIQHEVLYERIPEDEIDKLERELIKKYHSHIDDNGYNIEFGGNVKKEVHALTREKIRNSQTWQKGKGNPRYGKHCTKETRDKISESLRGKYVKDKSYWFGKNLPDETRNKLSIKAKERYKDKKNHPRYGTSLSESQRRLISENNSIPVIVFDLLGNKILKFDSATKCAETYNVNFSYVCNVCKENNLCLNRKWICLYEKDYTEEKLKNRIEQIKRSKQYKYLNYLDDVADLYNEGIKTTDIQEELFISRDLFYKCLKECVNYGMCSYRKHNKKEKLMKI